MKLAKCDPIWVTWVTYFKSGSQSGAQIGSQGRFHPKNEPENRVFMLENIT